jgi:hypothetical protein
MQTDCRARRVVIQCNDTRINIKIYKENYFDNVSVITCMKNEINFF